MDAAAVSTLSTLHPDPMPPGIASSLLSSSYMFTACIIESVDSISRDGLDMPIYVMQTQSMKVFIKLSKQHSLHLHLCNFLTSKTTNISGTCHPGSIQKAGAEEAHLRWSG